MNPECLRLGLPVQEQEARATVSTAVASLRCHYSQIPPGADFAHVVSQTIHNIKGKNNMVQTQLCSNVNVKKQKQRDLIQEQAG